MAASEGSPVKGETEKAVPSGTAQSLGLRLRMRSAFGARRLQLRACLSLISRRVALSGAGLEPSIGAAEDIMA